MSATQESVRIAPVPKDVVRYTGDWRGLPKVLTVLAIIGCFGSLIAGGMAGSATGNAAAFFGAFFEGLFSCLVLYCMAAVIACLRGVLATRIEKPPSV